MVDCKGNVSLFNRHVDRCLTKDQEENQPDPTKMEAEVDEIA